MYTDELLQLAGNFEGLPLTEPEIEALSIRMADMIRFKESYSGNLRYTGTPDGAISLADADAGRVGLAFYDSTHLTGYPETLLPQYYNYKSRKVTELWFVFVIDRALFSGERLNAFIMRHNIRQRFQKLFLLNFFESSLQQL